MTGGNGATGATGAGTTGAGAGTPHVCWQAKVHKSKSFSYFLLWVFLNLDQRLKTHEVVEGMEALVVDKRLGTALVDEPLEDWRYAFVVVFDK